MVVQDPLAPLVELAPSIDAGVINDARRRQWRQRRIAFVSSLAIVALGTAVYFGLGAHGGGGFSRRPVVVNAAVRPIATAAEDLRVTPSLWPGAVGLCVGTVDGRDSGTICDLPYPGRGIPVIESPGLPGWLAERPPPLGAEPTYLITASNVAKVKIGRTMLTPRAEADLPPGDGMLAVRIPMTRTASLPGRQPLREVKVTAFDRSGHVLPFAPRYLAPLQTSFKIVALHGLAGSPQARCVLGDESGYSSNPGLESKRIAGDRVAPEDAFFSCANSVYVRTPVARRPIEFYAAILLNGRSPGRRPRPLWGTAPLPGHPGLVENDSPPAIYNSDTFLSGSLIARRAGNAWLVAETQSGHPTLVERIQFITALQIRRLDLAGR